MGRPNMKERRELSRRRQAECPQVVRFWLKLLSKLDEAEDASLALADAVAALTPEQRALFGSGLSLIGHDARHVAWGLAKYYANFEADLPYEGSRTRRRGEEG